MASTIRSGSVCRVWCYSKLFFLVYLYGCLPIVPNNFGLEEWKHAQNGTVMKFSFLFMTLIHNWALLMFNFVHVSLPYYISAVKPPLTGFYSIFRVRWLLSWCYWPAERRKRRFCFLSVWEPSLFCRTENSLTYKHDFKSISKKILNRAIFNILVI